jgi:transmembrane sensor
MAFSSEDNIPWDLISSSFQGNLSPEEETQLQHWASSNPENEEFFSKLKKNWNEDFNDFTVYQEADENIAWDALRLRLKAQESETNENATIITGDFNKGRIKLIRWTSVAAIFVIMIGSFIWYMFSTRSSIYQTGKNEEQTVILSDGSSIKLYPETKIEISRDYNKIDRLITFKGGEAFFEVKHNGQVPFVVDMGTTSVKDIGTSFYIHNRNNSINVSVKTGEVAFTNNANNDTRNLSAGMSLKFQAGNKNSATVILIDSATVTDQKLLHFNNTALPDVILTFQQVYGKKIVLADTAISQKRFTANLAGQSFEEAMEILSKSLGVKYLTENNVYYLKNE